MPDCLQPSNSYNFFFSLSLNVLWSNTNTVSPSPFQFFLVVIFLAVSSWIWHLPYSLGTGRISRLHVQISPAPSASQFRLIQQFYVPSTVCVPATARMWRRRRRRRGDQTPTQNLGNKLFMYHPHGTGEMWKKIWRNNPVFLGISIAAALVGTENFSDEQGIQEATSLLCSQGNLSGVSLKAEINICS